MFFAAALLTGMAGAPLDMPRAEAFLAKRGGEMRLVDKYSTLDLWVSQTVLGRWYDDEGRIAVWSELKNELPPLTGEVQTRTEYEQGLKPLSLKDEESLAAAIAALAPVEIAAEFTRPRQKPRGFKDVRFYEGTNTAAIVCAFLPEKSGSWQLTTLELTEGDAADEWREKMWFQAAEMKNGGEIAADNLDERELLKRDAAHSVAEYKEWHFSDAGEYAVLDALPDSQAFVRNFTNDIVAVRRRFKEVMPSPLDGTNTLCVARIFANREDYLDAVGEDKAWTAAYWSQERRELVAYLPQDGEAELLKTLRHESFHQYLAYAGAMIMASPWINEGYAQYFEDERNASFFAGASIEELEAYASFLPTLLAMNYADFYGEGSRFNYRLAHSVAYFIENGAPKVRFAPFKDLKRDYMKALLETQDMKLATIAAFKNQDLLKLFIAEWLKFYKNM